MWTERGGRADLTGTTLLLNGATFTIVGVAPRSFVGTEPLAPGRKTSAARGNTQRGT